MRLLLPSLLLGPASASPASWKPHEVVAKRRAGEAWRGERGRRLSEGKQWVAEAYFKAALQVIDVSDYAARAW